MLLVMKSSISKVKSSLTTKETLNSLKKQNQRKTKMLKRLKKVNRIKSATFRSLLINSGTMQSVLL